jgi:hypothetical protein
MTANTAASIPLTGLLENTAYKFYFIAKDAANNVQAAVTAVPFTTLDGTAPVNSPAPTVASITTTGATASATINEAGTGYWQVQLASAAAPSVASLQSGGTSVAMTANTAASIPLTGLLENTAYKFYFIAKDAASNVQAVVSAVPFSTLALARTVTGTSGTVSFTGGSANCGYATTRFSPATNMAGSGSIGNAVATTPAVPSGYSFPYGVFGFITNSCGSSAALTFTATYPADLPTDMVFYKFGPTASNTTPHWYTHPFTRVDSKTISYTVTDGGAGDDDLVANGVVVDDGGPGFPLAVNTTAIPTLSEWALALLAMLMAGLGLRGAKRRQLGQ